MKPTSLTLCTLLFILSELTQLVVSTRELYSHVYIHKLEDLELDRY